MGVEYGMNVGDNSRFECRDSKERDHRNDLCVGGMILKWILKK